MQQKSVALWILCSVRRHLGPEDAMELKLVKLPMTRMRAASEDETEGDLNEYKINNFKRRFVYKKLHHYLTVQLLIVYGDICMHI